MSRESRSQREGFKRPCSNQCGRMAEVKGKCQRCYAREKYASMGRAERASGEAQRAVLERDLEQAKTIYAVTFGFAARVRWRRKITELEALLG